MLTGAKGPRPGPIRTLESSNPAGLAGLADEEGNGRNAPAVGPIETLENPRILLAWQGWLARMLKRTVHHPWALYLNIGTIVKFKNQPNHHINT